MTRWHWSSGGLLLVTAALLQAACLVFVWRRRGSAAAGGLAALLVAGLWWDAAHGLELLAVSPAGRQLWGAVKYAGIGLLPLAWWTFVLQYTGPTRGLPPWALGALAAVPATLLAILAVPPTRSWRYYPPGESSRSAASGPLFWPFVAYTGLMLVAGLVVFVHRLWRLSPVYRRQSLVLLGYAALPSAAILLFNLRSGPWGQVDPTPLAFSALTVVLTFGVFRFRLLRLRPVARDQIVSTLIDAVLVLDPYGRLIDVNPAGERLLGRPGRAAVGHPLAGLLPEATERLPGLITVRGRCYELRARPVRDRLGRFAGTLLLGRDITDEQRAEAGRRAAEARFHAAFDSALIGMALIDPGGQPRGRFLEVNPALAAISGHPEPALLERTLDSLFHPPTRPRTPPHSRGCWPAPNGRPAGRPASAAPTAPRSGCCSASREWPTTPGSRRTCSPRSRTSPSARTRSGG